MLPQSPKSIAPYSLAINETTIPMEAAAATETIIPMETAAATELPPVPAPELAIREKGWLIPISSLVRVMRRVLPPQAKVSDDAKELIQECVSEFISFVTGEANERCQGDHRTTVTGEDVIWAMERLGFDDYVAALRAYVRRMCECEGAGRGGGSGGRSRYCAQLASVVQHAPAPPVLTTAALHGMRVQAQPGAFPNITLAAHKDVVPLQVQFSAASRLPAQLGGERSAMAAYYGAPAISAEETTSSSEEEEPEAATIPPM
jgi:nuclear transcription Y subunit beta